MSFDDELLDSITDLSRLSDRQLLERIARAQIRLEQQMTQASEYLDQALDALDSQLQGLQSRLADDAAELLAALEQVDTNEGEHQAVLEAAQRVQATADLVGALALPSEVADPDNPAEALPVEPSDSEPPAGTPDGDPLAGTVIPLPPDADQTY